MLLQKYELSNKKFYSLQESFPKYENFENNVF